MPRSALRLATASVAAAALLLATAGAGSAEPTTTVSYPAGANTTYHQGSAFDTCDAPSLSAMQAWGASPYRGVGVYIGGPNRTCGQANLTAGWVLSVAHLGWRFIPVYMGRQAPCSDRVSSVKITAASAQGTASAQDAIAKARALGLITGGAIYGDMENYDTTDTSCRTAVLRYLSAWTKELHRQGWVAGVYANLSSGAQHLSGVYTSTAYARPDALWIARWDGSTSLTGWSGIADGKWADHQRGKQYRGDHTETYGGVTLNIDSDYFNGPVALPGFYYTVEGPSSVNARSGPSTVYGVVASYARGATLRLSCQAPGAKVSTTSVWDKLTNGSYVSDYYVSTPSNTGYSSPLPRCRYPYQTTAADGLSERAGPGTSYPVVRTLRNGSLAWVVCQRAGSKVGTTSVWNRLDDGNYVTDYYVATTSNTTYTRPAPRC
ncbi:MAG: DUF1906 domain-containing protein [Streptosporangiales bacterium]|nr:DUF1906 domain-containing protein [Streptosporangiales bacterium]MBO0890805.1 DUF1906 domain-containing protein [Acidothermales bacterium]